MQVFSQKAEWSLNTELPLPVTKKDSSDSCRAAHYCTRDSRINVLQHPESLQLQALGIIGYIQVALRPPIARFKI